MTVGGPTWTWEDVGGSVSWESVQVDVGKCWGGAEGIGGASQGARRMWARVGVGGCGGGGRPDPRKGLKWT